MPNKFLSIAKDQLHRSAIEYSFFIGKELEISSDLFKRKTTYKIKFTESNFLHLTGFATSLSPIEFYLQCLNNTISSNSLLYNEKKNKTTIKKKLKHLINLSIIAFSEIEVQEDFKKNRVICTLAVSNYSFTIGFVGGNKFLYPNTILDKNHLDQNKMIVNTRLRIK